MTTSLRSTIIAQLGWTWRDHVWAAPITDNNRLQLIRSLANGTGVNQADAVWHAEDQSLAAGTSTTLELDALEKKLFGDTIFVSLLTVKALLIVNKNSGGDGYLLVGGAAGDQWYAPFGAADDTVKVMPGGPLLLANPCAGWDVQLGASDLKIAAPADAVTYDVAILGTTTPENTSSSSSGT